METLTKLDTDWDNFPEKPSKLKRLKLKLKRAKDSVLSMIVLIKLLTD